MGGLATNAEELGHIRRLRSQGLRYNEIAKKLSRSATFIGQKCREMGVDAAGTTEATDIDTVDSAPNWERKTLADLIIATNLTKEQKIRMLEVIL